MHCTVKYSSTSLECQGFQQGFKYLEGNFLEYGCSLLRKHLLSTFYGWGGELRNDAVCREFGE